jgi:hypothetical protein
MRLFVALSVFCLVRRGKHAEKFSQRCSRLYAGGPESYWGEKTTTEGHQKIMKAKLVIAFVFLVMLWVSVAGVEYELVMWFGIVFNLFVSVFALCVLLGALFRAPEGYEDENGFHYWCASGRRPAVASQFVPAALLPFSLCSRSSPRRLSNGST